MALSFALHSISLLLLFEILIYDIFVPQTHTQKMRNKKRGKNKTERYTQHKKNLCQFYFKVFLLENKFRNILEIKLKLRCLANQNVRGIFNIFRCFCLRKEKSHMISQECQLRFLRLN